MTTSAITLYARSTATYADRLAHTTALLQQAANEHPGKVVLATSLGAEDMVLTHLIAQAGLPIAVATLDTGALHPETLALWQQIQALYPAVHWETYAPPRAAVSQFVGEHGPEAMYRSLALRKACCGLRKLEPLSRMLQSRTAWITGLRREQSDGRAGVAAIEADDHGRMKFNPLVDWSWAEVWHHLQLHQIPYNPLHDAFMPSIGCAPCTRAISVGEPFRAGRWWWEAESAKECGLHVSEPQR